MSRRQLRKDWSEAYAKQAAADYEAFKQLRVAGWTPQSQGLHFLQMAAEKLCRYYRCLTTNDAADLQSTHAVVEATIPLVLTATAGIGSGPATRPRRRAPTATVRRIGREIDLLGPSLDANGQRPDNCEYPWEISGEVRVPADQTFAIAGLLEEADGRRILTLFERAIDDQL